MELMVVTVRHGDYPRNLEMKSMNVKLLRAIQRRIKKEPRQFFMDWYLKKNSRIPNCHTAACVAGWAVTLTTIKSKKPGELVEQVRRGGGGNSFGDFGDEISIWQPAREYLGLNDTQSRRLFVEDYWPAKFQGSKRTLAKRAIARIEHMIKTGE